MLTLYVDAQEAFNEATNEFTTIGGTRLDFEHSLFSLASWESKWELPFLNTKDKTEEQIYDYIRMMYLGGEFPEEFLSKLTAKHLNQVNAYISANMTATTFAEDLSRSGGREIVTAEIIYYWMVAMQIPFECQHWHLNRLIALVKVVNEKNAPADKKKLSHAEVAARNRALNAERKAKYNTKG